MYNNIIKWAFESNSTLKNMTGVQREKILLNSKQVNYKKGEILSKQGNIIEKLIFVLEGGIKYVIFKYKIKVFDIKNKLRKKKHSHWRKKEILLVKIGFI